MTVSVRSCAICAMAALVLAAGFCENLHGQPSETDRRTYLLERIDDMAVVQLYVDGFDKLSQWEGILPALESAHAVAWIIKNAGQFSKDDLLIINVSGRGDKDVQQLAEWKAEQGAPKE